MFAGVGVGMAALALGVVGIWSAVSTRRRRAEIAETYRSTGGVFFTAIQVGCGSILILAGLTIVVL
ncbi:MAG TPA: hypothetical protein VG015_05730, partial [Candidatus Dormibacteraeota bacterium]|nr:hypothetical protein [Candidatus Dormibacteraeota bacterium]